MWYAFLVTLVTLLRELSDSTFPKSYKHKQLWLLLIILLTWQILFIKSLCILLESLAKQEQWTASFHYLDCWQEFINILSFLTVAMYIEITIYFANLQLIELPGSPTASCDLLGQQMDTLTCHRSIIDNRGEYKFIYPSPHSSCWLKLLAETAWLHLAWSGWATFLVMQNNGLNRGCIDCSNDYLNVYYKTVEKAAYQNEIRK